MTIQQHTEPVVHQGHFGEFTINQKDRWRVIIYRAGVVIFSLSFIIGSLLFLWQGPTPFVLQISTPLLIVFSLGLAISVFAIRVYFISLHKLLKLFWLMGTVNIAILMWQSTTPLVLLAYYDSLALFAVCFSFATLTGLYLKEAFCYYRFETISLTILVPVLFIGHVHDVFSLSVERTLLIVWTVLFIILVVRKLFQPLEPDIGDKSVFTYLEQRHLAKKAEKM